MVFSCSSKIGAVSVVVLLTTSVEDTQLLVEYCHFTTIPVCPERVSTVLLVPEQTVVEPAIEPPTEMGSTVITTLLLLVQLVAVVVSTKV